MNIWLFLCWVCRVVLGQKLVLSTILDIHICEQFGHILGEILERKTGRLGSRLASGRGPWRCHSSTWSYSSSTHLIHDCSTSALNDSRYRKLYRFDLMTLTFHALFHKDHNNVLLGAPTGFEKTVAAELAMLRVFESSCRWCHSTILSLASEAGAGFGTQLRLCGGQAERVIILHCSLPIFVVELLL